MRAVFDFEFERDPKRCLILSRFSAIIYQLLISK
jgi:hypothetical protein